MTRDALSAAVALFDGHPSAAKWHVRIRRLLSRLEDVEALVPASGNILEVGSGHGLEKRVAREPSTDASASKSVTLSLCRMRVSTRS